MKKKNQKFNVLLPLRRRFRKLKKKAREFRARILGKVKPQSMGEE